MSKKIIRHFEELELRAPTIRRGDLLGRAFIDALAGAAPAVATGLQAGQVFQVIGTPSLVEALRAGTHALMQSGQGALGTVVSSSGGRIAGQMRFAQASLAPVLAPVLAWQALHVIAATTQLHKINERLDVMQRKLETMQVRSEATVLGEVRWAVTALDDMLAERMTRGQVRSGVEARLIHVEKIIGSVLERKRALVDSFRAKTTAIYRLRATGGAVRASALLREEGAQAVFDMEMLKALVVADLRLEEVRLQLSVGTLPTELRGRLARVSQKVDEYRRLLASLPSVEELARHARACIDDMGWWNRKVLSRGVVDAVAEMENLGLHDVEPTHLASNYVFWRGKDGVERLCVLAEGDAELDDG